MAESKEQLRISAELDTSKLKQDAQSGFNKVVSEEKKVENQSKQTSRAVDGIGQSLNHASSQGTQALKNIGNEAEKTARKIASINTSVKDIKLGQVFNLANQFVNSDIARYAGGELGDALGLSDKGKGVASGIIGGALGGASTGAMVGGPVGAALGAAAGALTGAASALMQAAQESKEASRQLVQATGEISRKTIERHSDTLYRETTARRVEGYLANPESRDKLQAEIEGLIQRRNERINERNATANRINEVSQLDAGWRTGSERRMFDEMRSKELIDLNESYAESERDIAKINQRIEALSQVANILDRNAANAQKIAEAEAQAQAKTEWEADRQNRLDTLLQEKQDTISEAKGIESQVNWQEKVAGTRLTDALTQIGGGSGYYNRNLSISESIDKTLKTRLGELNNMVADIQSKIEDVKGETWQP